MSAPSRPREAPPVGGVRTALPPLLVLTDRHASHAGGRSLTTTVAAALDGGAQAVVLREKDLPPARRRAVAAPIATIVHAAGALLLVASDAALAGRLGAAGVHLAAGDPRPAGPGTPDLVGRSCHDAAEVRAALAEDVTYLTVSPVHPTASKPGHGPPLGSGGLAALVDAAADTPVYALGGVTPATAPACLEAGAAGVAVMGSVMRAPDPAATVARLLDAVTCREAVG